MLTSSLRLPFLPLPHSHPVFSPLNFTKVVHFNNPNCPLNPISSSKRCGSTSSSSNGHTWPDGDAERYCSNDNLRKEDDYAIQMFGSDEELSSQIPTQVQTLVEGSGSVLVSEYKPVPDVDYLQELLAIQQQGPRNIGFFGTRNMGFMHQELIEILSYALVITKNHIFTSGAAGTNAAVIRGALRAEKPELLTVILPQSLEKQPPESQELLSKVQTGNAKISWNSLWHHLPLGETCDRETSQ
ncbi:uncharacterized protein LOC107028781 isoform X2 [Solanum pennellii]|uniref:Uncharacterized protein LOC107028781 isoform X2 n=1 Tax=Solanum pennellii TaxID=28526 RepID=A0ABM1VGN8_SOLPN|nr:uncharacterized protein LOC107028781 isoform X2 [Solanum pennellii]